MDRVTGRIRSEFAGYVANLDQAVSGIREEFAGLSQQVSAALNIFARQPQASLPIDFPSRATSEPILTTPRARQGFDDPIKAGDRGETEDGITN